MATDPHQTGFLGRAPCLQLLQHRGACVLTAILNWCLPHAPRLGGRMLVRLPDARACTAWADTARQAGKLAASQRDQPLFKFISNPGKPQ